MAVFFQILGNNIIPIFILIIFGFLLSKKFNLDINTLSKLNFYIFVPGFLFFNLYSTEIPKGMFKIITLIISFLIINAIIGLVVTKVGKFENGMTSAFQNSIMFYNSGNFGVPLITLVFSNYPFIVNGDMPYLNLALTTQIMIMIVQDLTTNIFGFINAGGANTHWKESFKKVLKMPSIYVVPFVIILKLIPYDFTKFPLWPAIGYMKNGLISIALITLGVQLAKTKYNFKNKAVYISVFIRLIIGPIIAYLLIIIFGFQGIVAQTIMISSSVPTAVTTALIAVECDNFPDFTSQSVMLSTLLSLVTLTGVICMVNRLFPVI